MSLEAASEHVCYVHCNFCNTILAVSVPCNNLYNIVTVRCGHCANLLSVNMGALLQTFPLQDFQRGTFQLSSGKLAQVTCMYTSTLWRLEETKYGPYFRELKKEINLSLYQENSVPRFGDLWGKTLTQNHNFRSQDYGSDCGSSSKCNKMPVMNPAENDQPQMLPIRPPGKRQRVPSAYNRFIKEEIQRIKTSNPDISHRQAFSAAAKNWAHFPHIHFGLNLDNSKQVKLDETIAGEGSQKSQGFY